MDTMTFDATLTTEPARGTGVGSVSLTFPLGERESLKASTSQRYALDGDTPVTVPLAGLAAVHVAAVRVAGSNPVTVTVDGEDILVRRTLYLTSPGIAALVLTGTADVTTDVDLFLGELA